MTPAQKKWLNQLQLHGYVESGYLFGRSQRNRPLRALVLSGHALETSEHPDGGYCHGFVPTEKGKATKL